jgi:hypothetical protein
MLRRWAEPPLIRRAAVAAAAGLADESEKTVIQHECSKTAVLGSLKDMARQSRNQRGAPVGNRLGTTHRAKPVTNRRSNPLEESSRRTPILRDSTAKNAENPSFCQSLRSSRLGRLLGFPEVFAERDEVGG